MSAVGVDLAPARHRAEPQAVLDGERGEHLPSFGNLGDAWRRVDALPFRSAAGKADAAARRRLHARDGGRAGLARAVRSHQRDSPSAIKRHAMQGLDVATTADQVVNRQHG
jgi:hypothetical protein